MSDWLSKLEKEIKAEYEQPPKGWVTNDQFAERTGMSREGSRHNLLVRVKSGQLQRKKFRGEGGHATWFYGPK